MVLRLRLLGALLLVSGVRGQRHADDYSCGPARIPYKILIDSSGTPELFCDSPVCIGPNAETTTTKSRAREGKNGRSETKETLAVCGHELLETVCVGVYEWTSGLLEINNGTHRTLKTECCSFDGMSEARELKTVLLEAGDFFEGGGVRVRGRDVAFDLVKEVRKTVNSENRVQYVISIYRMPCGGGEGYSPYAATAHKRMKMRMQQRRAMAAMYEDFDEGPYSSRRKSPPEYDDYDVFPRRRPMYARRRQYPRRAPVMDEYYEYDLDIPMSRRALYRRPRKPVGGFSDDRLWPVAYNNVPAQPMQVSHDSPQRARAYADPTPLPTVYEQEGDVVSAQMPLQQLPVAPSQSGGLMGPGAEIEMVNGMPMLAQATSYTSGPIPPTDASFGGSPPAANSYPSAPAGYTGYAMSVSPDSYASPPDAYATVPMQNAYAQPPPPQVDPNAQANAQPAQNYYGSNYGSSGAGLNGVFGAMQCFSGDMEVETPAGRKAIKDLKTGDQVLSIEENMMSFSPVIMFLHREENERAEFIIINTEHGQRLKLTENHLVYITERCALASPLRLVKAKEVRLGDCVSVLREPLKTSLRISKVTSLSKNTEKGIYAPLTVTGDIIVSDVLASCHANLAVKTLQQSFFTVYRSASRTISSFFSRFALDDDGFPPGIAYIVSVLDLFVPTSLF